MILTCFAHPLRGDDPILVFSGGHLRVEVQTRVVQAAMREHDMQAVLVGQVHPALRSALPPAATGFTPEALRAEVVTVPDVRHAVAHARAAGRALILVHGAPNVSLDEYARHWKPGVLPVARAGVRRGGSGVMVCG